MSPCGPSSLDDRAFSNEQPGQADRFFQGPAAIASQIQHDTAHVLRLQFGKQPRDIRGGAAMSAHCMSVDVDVERRQVDHTHSNPRALARGQVQDSGPGRLVFELYLVAHQGHHPRNRTISVPDGDHGQRHRSALRTANQLHRAREGHVHDVERLLHRLAPPR
jgi:hypothetical protein